MIGTRGAARNWNTVLKIAEAATRMSDGPSLD